MTAVATAPSSPAAPPPIRASAPRRVIPAVDVARGVVLIAGPQGTERLQCGRAAELAAALGRAVDSPVWDAAARVLEVRVAATGHRRGLAVEFRLA